MLKILYADVSPLSSETEGYALSHYRRGRLEKILPELNRKQSIGAELLLNHAVESVLPGIAAPFEIIHKGESKPVFADIPLEFSISHSGNFSACVVSDSAVGIDIQQKRRYEPALAKRFFAPEECIRIECSSDKDETFTLIWSAKEAVLKFLGTGLKRGLSSVHIIDETVAVVLPENLHLSLRYFIADNFAICLCAEKLDDMIDFSLVEL